MHGKNCEGFLISLVVERWGLHMFSLSPISQTSWVCGRLLCTRVTLGIGLGSCGTTAAACSPSASFPGAGILYPCSRNWSPWCDAAPSAVAMQLCLMLGQSSVMGQCCCRERQAQGISLNCVPGQGCSEGTKNRLIFWCTTCRSNGELVSLSRTGQVTQAHHLPKALKLSQTSALWMRCPSLCAQQQSSLQQPTGGLCLLPPAPGLCGHGQGWAHLPWALEPRRFQQTWKVFSACLKAVFTGWLCTLGEWDFENTWEHSVKKCVVLLSPAAFVPSMDAHTYLSFLVWIAVL